METRGGVDDNNGEDCGFAFSFGSVTSAKLALNSVDVSVVAVALSPTVLVAVETGFLLVPRLASTFDITID